MLIATTSKSSPPSFACSASSAGISLRHGTHQVAHRFSSTVRPRNSRKRARLAVGIVERKIGQPPRRGRDADAPRPRRAPGARGAWRAPPPAGMPHPAALRCIAPIPYTAASPTATPAIPPSAITASRRLANAFLGQRVGHRRAIGGRVMSNKMWGGRFASGPGAIMQEINASIDFDRRLYRQDIAASKAHAAMLAKQGIISRDDAREIAHGLDTILSEMDSGQVPLQAGARRHPYERGVAACRADRAGGRAAAYRALAQRPGRDRLQALGARRDRRDRRGARRLPAKRSPRRRWRMPRP